MSATVGTLLRRGVEMGTAHFQQDPEEQYRMPIWGGIIFGVTMLAFIFISGMISYTFGRVITTLLMVESPEAILFEPITTTDPDAPIDNINKAVEPELLLMKQQPITSSFRQTIKHLQSKGGFRARFRGLSIFIVYSLVVSFVSSFVNVFVPTSIGLLIGPVIASVACSQLGVAWTHIVISDPSPKPWFRRIPSIKTWKKVAGPTAIAAVAAQLAVILPIYVAAQSMGSPEDFANGSHGHRAATAGMGLGFFLLSIALTVCLAIPTDVALTRVQASLLPDEAESIVPFDRTFGGKVIPEIVGGSGMIGMLDAWNSFDWNSRVRLIKAYIKVFAMQFAVALFFIAVVGAEVALIVGKDLPKLLPGDGKDRDSL